jgi:DNA-binding MarR family transcriptional regulator
MADALAGGPPGEVVGLIELLFFAYRDFTGEADQALANLEFGRAHHRVLHFVNRRPGLRVADLLDILKITKQSLAPVLKELVDTGFIVARPGARDRRERQLTATEKGRALAVMLDELQAARIRAALAAAGPGHEGAIARFLTGLIQAEERGQIHALIAGSAGAAAAGE